MSSSVRFYPMDLKCRSCGKRKGDHSALSLFCPQGRKSRTMGYTQFSDTLHFLPTLPKLPKEIQRGLVHYQEALDKYPTWNLAQEYERYWLFHDIKAALDKANGKVSKFRVGL